MKKAMSALRAVAVLSLVATSLPVIAQSPARAVASTRVAQRGTARMLPGTRGNVLTTIQGNALTSTNGPLANAGVRLRDARSGRIVDTQYTDESGLFAFPNVEPGSYIVELMAEDQTTVLAASQILN